MVVSFSLIPLHIQKAIVEKMNLGGFRDFVESSKECRYFVTNAKVTKYQGHMTLKKNVVRFGQIPLRAMQTFDNCPRFLITTLNLNDDYTDDILAQIVAVAERGLLTGRDSTLNFGITKTLFDKDLINRLIQLFNVTEINSEEHLSSMYLREFQAFQLKAVSLKSLSSIQLVLALDAPKIEITANYFTIHTTLNTFFKEWFYKCRNITRVLLNADDGLDWKNVDPDLVFAGLPYTVIWSRETHHNSCVSRVPLNKLDDWPFNSDLFYSLDNGEKILYIAMHKTKIVAEEVTDPREEVFSAVQRYG